MDHAKPCESMKMEVPGLADSLQQCLYVNRGIYAGDVLDQSEGLPNGIIELLGACRFTGGLKKKQRFLHGATGDHLKIQKRPNHANRP